MNKILMVVLAGATALSLTAAPAEARGGRNAALAVGIIGGLVAGAAIANAASDDDYDYQPPRYYQRPTYYYTAPPVVYRVPPRGYVYRAPPPVYYGEPGWQRTYDYDD